MTKAQEYLTYQSGCHFRVVRFKVLIDRYTVENCNCFVFQFFNDNWEDNVDRIRS